MKVYVNANIHCKLMKQLTIKHSVQSTVHIWIQTPFQQVLFFICEFTL